jgi:hypothetical protein
LIAFLNQIQYGNTISFDKPKDDNESYEPIVYRIKLSVFTGKFENEWDNRSLA